MNFHVYILKNRGNKLYIGHSKNIVERIVRHNSAQGARFTKDNENFELVYLESYERLIDAVGRERQLKRWSRAKKEALIAGDKELLKML